MPEQPRPPVTLRISRPYGSEDEFVEGDFAWLGRATIVLPHAAPRPAGELIRFELVLSTGAPIFRGEGHVVAHYVAGSGKPPGLEVRFTRIDARSKMILDRVRTRRQAVPKAASLEVAHVESQLDRRDSPPVPALPSPAERPSAAIVELPVLRASVDWPSERSGVRLAHEGRRISPPPNRDDILARLRERAQHLAANGGFVFKNQKKQEAS